MNVRSRLAALVFFWGATTPFFSAVPASDAPYSEQAVKAALVLNFTRYIEWPQQVLERPDKPILICILAAPSFAQVLDKLSTGQTDAGHNIAVRHFERLEKDVTDCNVIFVSRENEEHDHVNLGPLANTPICTIGDSDDFLENGGIIQLIVVNKNVRFKVSLRAAKKARLKLSSRMLSLAQAVID